MKNRKYISRFALGLSALAILASTNTVTAQGLYLKKSSDQVGMHEYKSQKRSQPGLGNFKAKGSADTHGLQHDSDEQLDVWVARCNDAGGGMVLASDGNYDCHDANGNDIEDY